ncbi:MAG: Uma2 family endonuclease [Dehalococcoidia bacterium]|jgi:Uma2 family endonuclease
MALRAGAGGPAVYPLESGDRLSRAEFERRYEAMPDVKAELIEGVVYVASPVSLSHGGPHARLAAWLAIYADLHPGCEVFDNATVRLGASTEVQPDLLLRREPGLSRRDTDDYLQGSPELVIEIAASSVSIDLHAKRRAYERGGVPEYLVWRTRDREVDWFELRNGRYARLEPEADGILESRQFPGLRLSVDVLLDGLLRDLVALLR